MKVAFYTLGCKMNYHETAYMEEAFKERGYEVVPFGEKADIYVINTCTVTSVADAKSRKAVRKAKSLNPNSLVVVSGCYSEVYPEEVEKIGEADFITGNAEKFRIVELVEGKLRGELPRTFIKGVWKERRFYPLTLRNYEGRSRAFLKVQQGCELFCSYCVIPKARGRMLSLPPKEVLSQVKELVDLGYKEIVLTGTHLGGYGLDLGGDWNLAKLVKEIVKVPNLYRLRLSSIEPLEFTPELIDVITSSEKVAPHFHIPLQSASRKVLERMRRRYSPADYERVVEEILKRCPDAAIGTDVMVGFPGEGREEFKETEVFVKELPFSYLHVFPYSPRPGTVAYTFKDSVSPNEKKMRAKTLREIGKAKSLEYRNRFIGKELDCLVLSELKGEKSVAISGNYINVILDRNLPSGSVVKVKLKEVKEKREENYGEVVG